MAGEWENDLTAEVEEHRNLSAVMLDMFMEFINFFKYIFYDMWLGK